MSIRKKGTFSIFFLVIVAVGVFLVINQDGNEKPKEDEEEFQVENKEVTIESIEKRDKVVEDKQKKLVNQWSSLEFYNYSITSKMKDLENNSQENEKFSKDCDEETNVYCNFVEMEKQMEENISYIEKNEEKYFEEVEKLEREISIYVMENGDKESLEVSPELISDQKYEMEYILGEAKKQYETFRGSLKEFEDKYVQ